jgi:DEAD/DEAH box helicase domain-containing protein
MSQLDAMTLSKAIRGRLVDFSLDDNYVRDERLRDICQKIWAGVLEYGGLVSDLWVEGAFPAQTVNETLASLVYQGLFHGDLCRHLDQRKAVPRDRPLYEHQREAILRAQSDRGGMKPALVVTAGTGTGKTESFLLPILNDLFTNSRTHEQGVQCLILYPMNALVNDQVDRLYDWLQGQDHLTLFHFTGETPEDAKAADDLGVKPWEQCRMRTRREARGFETHEGKARPDGSTRGPQPDILITNYSMLEYMLCRA